MVAGILHQRTLRHWMLDFNLSTTSIVLHNQAILEDSDHNEKVDQDQKTFVIFGVPRGGTTMVARVVGHLGVYLGDDLRANYEDHDFNFDIMPDELKRDKQKLLNRLSGTVDSRNQKFTTWGWKYPRAMLYLPQLIEKLRNPHFICVTRDPVASAMRSISKVQKRYLRSLKKGAKSMTFEPAFVQKIIKQHLSIQQGNIQFINESKVPTFICSYEKAVANSVEFVNELAGFLALPCSSMKINDALTQIQPGGYIQDAIQ